MVGHVDVLHIAIEHLFVGVNEECVDFILHLVSLSHVSGAELSSMFQLEDLKLKSDTVLVKELGVFVVLVEGGCGQFLSPPWCSVLLEGRPDATATSVWVVDDLLIVIGLTESPWVSLIKTVIDNWGVGIGRVGVHGLTLSVEEEELLIGVSNRDEWSNTHGGSLLGHLRLQTLEVVSFVHLDIIHVVELVTVLSERLVESDEGVVHHWLVDRAINDLVE